MIRRARSEGYRYKQQGRDKRKEGSPRKKSGIPNLLTTISTKGRGREEREGGVWRNKSSINERHRFGRKRLLCSLQLMRVDPTKCYSKIQGFHSSLQGEG